MDLPFELQVTGFWQAQELIDQCWPTKIVTLLSPQQMPTQRILSNCDDHLRIIMHDVTSVVPGWIAPNADHIKNILNFTQGFTGQDRVLIHCQHGVGASTSVSMGVLVQHGIDPASAIHAVENINSGLDPNELVIYLMDPALDLKMKLIDTYQSWAASQHRIMANRMPRAWRNEIDDNAREFYRTWHLHKAVLNGPDCTI